ncbi:type II and III secretion system protein family protein [Zophobihabitans entericus]|uniref:Tight adherence secretin RcpA n=1 Tax=Zophobihabitans entericus TaxID=1635327 RepID=A0A6G9IBV7_9GAMM|nr:pilus assembly protein N-terminal domain-containing protein [Zophobihabitans entericus]QIQ21309.1 tight adherence secretin RcpA [Zophobihabitans entericus]
MASNWRSYFSVFIGTVLLFSSMTASAAVFYLKPGQSKTIKSDEVLGTVFVSNPEIADYRVVGDNTVTLFAKNRGYADFVIYGKDDQILASHSVEVDPIVPDLHYRIKREFPESNIRISSFVGSGISQEKASYLLSGTVPDDLTRERIYAIVGSSVGDPSNDREEKTDYAGNDVFFMYHRRYDNIIDKIQITKNNQVNVKLTLVEVSKQFTDTLGIEWQNLTLDSIISGGTNISSVGTFNLLGLKHGFDINNVSTIIRAVQNDELAKILAEPNLTVLSGETASFLVGGEIPIVTRGSDDNSSSITYKEYGIKLDLGAQISSDTIRLLIGNEFSSVSGSYSFNDYQIPTLTTRRTRSTIEVKDGDSFIISGLVSEHDVESLTRVPFISDIPILGALARSTSTSRNKTELVVFATVKLVNPASSFENAYIPSFERTDYRNIFFNYNNNHDKQGRLEFPITNESESFLGRVGFLE